MNKRLEKLPGEIAKSIGSLKSIIIHTIFFVSIFFLVFLGISFSDILLILTTIVSLEAIYLSIFIQISVNKQLLDFKNVSKDIEDIQENVEYIQKDVEEIQENVD